MPALFALRAFQPSSLAVGEVDKLIIRVDHEEELSLVASCKRNNHVRFGYFHVFKAPL